MNVQTPTSVILKPLTLDDECARLEAVQESVAELVPYCTWCQANYSEDDNRNRIQQCTQAREQGQEYHFVVSEEESGVFGGEVAVDYIDREQRYGNVTYWTRAASQGRGLASAAVRALADFCFSELQLTKLEILMAIDNVASIWVAQNAGATFEGLIRNYRKRDGQVEDVYRYVLLSSERT